VEAFRRIALSAPDVGDEERRLVDQVLRSPDLACGPMIDAFEQEWAARLGARAAIAVSNGTAGLHLSLIAAGVQQGDFVITSPFSFVATANVILYERAVPIFVDIDPDTLAIDVERTLEAMDTLSHRGAGDAWLPRGFDRRSGAVRAVVPVHLFGRPMEMSAIVDASRQHRVAVVEDACEAIGASIDGLPVGRWGDTGVFAFYPNKQMTTGEGGMIVTDRDDWVPILRSLRNHGRDSQTWTHKRLGYNYRLDELSAALGLAQTRRLDELLDKRAAVAERYRELLAGIDGLTPLAVPRHGMRMSWFAFIVRLDGGIDRDRLIARLDARGVPTRPYFPAIHLQPFYRERFGYRPGDFPHAEAASRSLLALPFHGRLADDDIQYVCEALAKELAIAPSARSGKTVA
jgi:dTDP-4-amino-4,6-dideoxygalactose transaminase